MALCGVVGVVSLLALSRPRVDALLLPHQADLPHPAFILAPRLLLDRLTVRSDTEPLPFLSERASFVPFRSPAFLFLFVFPSIPSHHA